MSLRLKFLSIFLFLAVLNIVGTILMYSGIGGQRSDAVVINLAGAQRMLSQQIAKETFIAGQSRSSAHLLNAVNRFDRVLNALLKGDAELKLPHCNDPEIAQELASAGTLWTPFKAAAIRVANKAGSTENDQRFVSEKNIALMLQMDRIVKLLQRKSESKISRMLQLQLGILATLLAVIALSWKVVISSLLSHLTQTVDILSSGSKDVTGAAHQIDGSSQALAGAATQQASSLVRTAEAVTEISQVAKKNSQLSLSVVDLLNQSDVSFRDANVSLSKMTTAMDQVSSSSSKISRIIQTIEGIAFQTNILALNAAVEAARAGEAGAGFAVVADEVRSLARRCSEAAKDTTTLIEESQSNSENGTASVQHVVLAIQTLAQNSTSIRDFVKDLSSGNQEQTSGMEQISEAVTQIEIATQNTAAIAEEGAAAAEELNAQSIALQQVADDLCLLVGAHR